MSSSVENYLDKILTLMKEKISKNTNLFFPCKEFIFHQAKLCCIDCQNFICNKCMNNHDKSHKIFSLEEIIDYFNSNISKYKDSFNEKITKTENEEKNILDESFEKTCLEEIDNLMNKLMFLKEKMMMFSNLKKNLFEKYNSDDKNILEEQQITNNNTQEEKLKREPLNLKEVKEIHDLIKYENNNTKVFEAFLSFCKNLENKNEDNNENNNIQNPTDSKSIYEQINFKTNELDLIIKNSFINKIKDILKNDFPNIENKIEKNEVDFKNMICSNLKINEEEYLKEFEKTEKVEEKKEKDKEKIVEIPKEIIIEKKVEIEVPIEKKKFIEKELKIESKEKINILGVINNNPKETEEEKDIEKEPNKIGDNKENQEAKEDNKESNAQENDEDNEESDNDNVMPLNENNSNKPKISGLKRSTAIKSKSKIDSYSSLLLSTKSVNEIYLGTYNQSNAVMVIKDNKYFMETSEEIEITKKSCHDKLNNLNLAKTKDDFDLNKELSKFSWKERNMFELIYPVEDQKIICVYNPYINQVEEIEIKMNDKFPVNCAIYFKLPYCFVSGGKILNEDEDLEETNSFYALRREGPKIFEKMILPEMLKEKSNHCLFEVPYIKSLCSLGGRNSKDVEMFDLDEKNWKTYPELNYPRESPACCVINETYIYCFFGYDNENATYLTSIEKYDLLYNPKWEVLNPYGNKTFMKKRMCGCVKYRKNFEENIYILGGINILNKESKDCLVYNEKNNTIEKEEEMSLPYKSSFNSCSFIQLPNGLYYNLNMDNLLIQYESLGKYFFGIRIKEI